MYWLSARTRNDLFLLYCFADTGQSVTELRAALANRVTRIPDLLVHVLDTPANIAYPVWATCEFIDEQFVAHDLGSATWANVTTALGGLLDTGVRAEHRAWRLHLFRGIAGAPGFGDGESALVAVLQLSHALADGRRAAAIARALFGDADPVEPAPDAAPTALPLRIADRTRAAAGNLLNRIAPAGWADAALAVPKFPIDMARTVIRGIEAFRAERKLAELVAAGTVPPPPPGAAPNLLNGGGESPAAHEVRMIVRNAAHLRVPGHTVTVVVSTAISLALQRYLSDRGEPAQTLRAQLPMAFAADGNAHNSYYDLSVDLAVREPDPARRAAAITADLAIRRERAQHPLQEARARVNDTVPAPILHRDITGFAIGALPETVSGHTVISSVHRGPADLVFGGGRVRFTAGFPGLGSVMHLTHGIHGLGDTVTVSIHADPVVLPDLDAYVSALSSALDEVAGALRPGKHSGI